MLLVHHPVAYELLVGAAVTTAVGELVATCLGHVRDGFRLTLRRPADVLLRRRGAETRQDRGTRIIVAIGIYAGIAAAIAIANSPSLRGHANSWWTLGLGLAVALSGGAFRDWAIISLGRYFRRVVTIEPGQRIVRRGPYRVLRHPSYTGLLLILTGFALALGSWVGAAAALLIGFGAMLPRIWVEEHALARAFGAEYDDYATSTARLLPHVW